MPGLPTLSPAAVDLGFGGEQLRDQVQGETEEMRKKRMAAMALQGQSASPATLALFGSAAAQTGGARGGPY